ncbi:MAG: hypothetical protein RMM17_01080 [Acidobacteriota bacterium]|nr:hypothetical protein [Blastocatellia bacterium]MDW8411261.1 hypothetical protein [Acidobacteriota bacterium]
MLKKHLRVVVGFVLIFLGFIGLLIPVLPSSPFFISGIAMVGAKHPLIRPFMLLLKRWRHKLFPKPIDLVDRFFADIEEVKQTSKQSTSSHTNHS